MRHVTDGELHAYLDGALDTLPTERVEEVRSHLGICPVCQERLQDEEEIRAMARDLLSSTAPSEAVPPPFEELRDMVLAGSDAGVPSGEGNVALPGRRLKPLRGLPLAWAATVVLALGVGWMGGRIWLTMPEDGRFLAPAGPAESRDDEGLDFLSEEAAEVEGGEGAVSVEDRSEGLAQGRGGVVPPAAEGAISEAMIPPDPEEAGVHPGEAIPVTVGGVELPRRDAQPGDSVPDLAKSTNAVQELQSRLAPAAVRAAIPSAFGDTVEPRRRMEVEPGLETTLAVPGLKVLSVEWEEWIPGENGLHIRQLLPSGDTLELRYLGMLMGTDPDPREKIEGRGEEEAVLERPHTPKGLEASLPPGWNQEIMRWGRGWLVARAPLPSASIRALLRSLF